MGTGVCHAGHACGRSQLGWLAQLWPGPGGLRQARSPRGGWLARMFRISGLGRLLRVIREWRGLELRMRGWGFGRAWCLLPLRWLALRRRRHRRRRLALLRAWTWTWPLASAWAWSLRTRVRWARLLGSGIR